MVIPVSLVRGLCVHLLSVQYAVVVPEHLPVVIIEPRARLVERCQGEVGLAFPPGAAVLTTSSQVKARGIVMA